MIDRVCVKVQDHLNSLRNSETEAILEDVRSAENLIKDARNSKTVRIAKFCARARWVSLPFLHLYICPPPPPTAAAQPLSLRLGSQGGAEQLISGAYSEETGVYGWRGDNGHGPATAGTEETWTDVKTVVLLN